MGQGQLDPSWSFGPAGERYEIEVQYPNTFRHFIKGWQPETVGGLMSNPGVVATAAHCVNSILAVCSAEPGIRVFDLPPLTGAGCPCSDGLR